MSNEWTLKPKEYGYYWIYDTDWKGFEQWDETFIGYVDGYNGNITNIHYGIHILNIDNYPAFMYNGPLILPKPLPNHPVFT